MRRFKIPLIGTIAIFASASIAGFAQLSENVGSYNPKEIAQRIFESGKPSQRIVDEKARANAPVDRDLNVRPRKGHAGKLPAYSQQFAPVSFGAGVNESPMKTESGKRIRGLMWSSDSWPEDTYYPGLYEFNQLTYGDFNLIKEVPLMGTAAVFYDGKILTWDRDKIDGVMTNIWRIFDAYSLDLLDTILYDGKKYIVDAMIRDSETGDIYAFFYNFQYSSEDIGIVNLKTGKIDAIDGIGDNYTTISAAVQKEPGYAYGFLEDGTVNKYKLSDATFTEVGKTGAVSTYKASCVIDPSDGMCYYLTSCGGGSGMYKIDLATGTGELLYNTPYNEEILAMTFAPDPAAAGAPSTPALLNVNFPNGSLTGTVEFTAPTTLNDGTKATGSFNYELSVDGEESITGTANFAGGLIKIPATVATIGSHYFKLTLSNEAGNSDFAYVRQYIGPDSPLAVENATLTWENGTSTVTWDAALPEHGGYLSGVTYNITRIENGEATEVATGITETSYTEAYAEPTEKIVKLIYEVTTVYDGKSTEPVATNAFNLGYAELPFTETFDTKSSLEIFTIIDANKDGKSWEFNNSYKCAQNAYSDVNSANDYLVLPKVTLKKGTLYIFTFDAFCGMSSYPERVTAYVGTSPTPEGLATQLMQPVLLTSKTAANQRIEYLCPEDGTYYFAIKAVSDPNMHNLRIDNITLSEIDGNLPAAVSDYTATADATGACKVSLAFTAPVKNIFGETLTSLEKVEIYRNDELLESLTATPGQSFSYVDETPEEGYQTYTVKPVSNIGTGVASSLKVFVGFDVPAMVSGAIAKRGSHDGEAVISWNPVTTDARGNKLPENNVKYNVAMRVGEEIYTVATGLTTTSYTHEFCDANDMQYLGQYGIFAQNDKGMSEGTGTMTLAFGKPYEIPFIESFKDGEAEHAFTTLTLRGGGEWYINDDELFIDVQSQDGDNGYANFNATNGYDTAALLSGAIDLTNAVHPGLTFYYRPVAENDINTLRLAIALGDGEVPTYTGKTITLGTDGTPEVWNRAVYSLEDFKGKKIQLAIVGQALMYANIFVDNIKLVELNEKDLELTIDAPHSVEAGQTASVKLMVENLGALAADSYSIEVSANGTVVDSDTYSTLNAADKNVIAVEIPVSLFASEKTEISAKLIFNGDQNLDNNEVKATILTTYPEHPVPTDVEATTEGKNVNITWVAPDLTTAPTEPIFVDFENYESFAHEEAEGWKFIDRDFGPVGGFKNMTIPNLNPGTPASFVIFDFTDSKYRILQGAYSGKKSLFALYNYDYSKNDDWAISPELSGSTQYISMYARSYSKSYPESFEILYSTSVTDNPEDFELLEDVYNVPGDWTLYTFKLPAGAKHFAIRYTSEGKMFLNIDDVTFSPAGSDPMYIIKGYNVYRDGVKVNEELLTENKFTYVSEDDDKHIYNVTTVYTKMGESIPSEGVSVQTSDITDIVGDDNDTEYYTTQGIKVETPVDGEVYITVKNGKATKQIYKAKK